MSTPGESAMRPTVAVIIPYYNGSRTIHSTLESVFAQTHPAQEVILVDDGSSPKEAATLEVYRDRCRIVRLPRNVGPSMARNVGIGFAASEWIAFLDSDDLWEPEKLARQLDYVPRHADCVAVHTAVRAIPVGRHERVYRKSFLTSSDFMSAISNPATTPTVLIKRDVLLACGLFDATKRYAGDQELFLRISLFHPFHYLDEPLTIRRSQADGLSMHHMAVWDVFDRWLRYYRNHFPSNAAFRSRMRELSVTHALHAVYTHQFRALWKMFWRVTGRDVSRLGLVWGMLVQVARNRWQRASKSRETENVK